MPSPLGDGLTYKGTDLQAADLSIFLEVAAGGPEEPPIVRGKDWIVPKSVGVREGSRVAYRRDITLEGWIKGSSRSNMRTLEQTIRTLFLSTTTPGDLVMGLEDGTDATIRARPLAIVWGEISTATRELTVTLESTTAPEWTIA